MKAIESIYDEYGPIYTESVATAYRLQPKWNQRESAYVSKKRMWRTLPEPSSKPYAVLKELNDA